MDLVALITGCAPGIAPATMAAIVAHESGGNPYAINLNSKTHRISFVPRTKVQAISILRELQAGTRGTYDIGLGQINSVHLTRLGLNSADLLNPCTNLRVTAQVLGECFKRTHPMHTEPQTRLAQALSCYNTGSLTRGFRNGYVEAIYRQARRQPTREFAKNLQTLMSPKQSVHFKANSPGAWRPNK